MAKWQKGQSGNPRGKLKGTRNRTSRAVVEAILETFDELGGAAWLRRQDPKLIAMLVARVVPKDVNLHADVNIAWERMVEQYRQSAPTALGTPSAGPGGPGVGPGADRGS